jgi:molybdopterin-binding protein
MNVLNAEIVSFDVKKGLSLVKLNVGGISLTSIVIDTPESVSYLRNGGNVKVIFKETEVIVGKGIDHQISLQNKFPGTVAEVESGDLLSKVSIDTAVGIITSIITNNAVKQLGIVRGAEVTAMVKTNEIMLSE